MKRKGSAHGCGGVRKKAKGAGDQSTKAIAVNATHPVLQRLYPEVLTLRQYLLSRLPSSSKNRYRKLSQLGCAIPAGDKSTTDDLDNAVVQLLDSALVCTAGVQPQKDKPTRFTEEREKDIEAFTQQRSQSTPGGTFKPGYYRQSEIIDFVIWRLFKSSTSHKPAHLLCYGFQRAAGSNRRAQGNNDNPSPSIPGLQERLPNSFAKTLKEPVWCRLHALLGQGGDRIIIDMLLECSIFIPVNADTGNYYQLSGVPVHEVKSDENQKSNIARVNADKEGPTKPSHLKIESKKPGAITFVRSRMLYAKAALNAKGGVRFGMRHIHVLNRFTNREDKQETIHIMRYIFPRQFGLHNVFTSKVDPRETAMPFKDYTLREKDIHTAMCRELGPKGLDAQEIAKWKQRTPKRLRGDAVKLVDRLRVRNQRCSYMEMLRHYCPIEGVPVSTKPDWRKSALQPKADVPSVADLVNRRTKARPFSVNSTVQETCFTDLACPAAHVSAFCRAVISKVIPEGFWGNEHNKHNLMYWVDQFLDMRRFESLNLHQVTQHIQVRISLH
ncbi:hypothetical protein BKA58DRAFT_210337 [Alternaria rosae]|uniref:uncharacterized protein n=1 Tax=Alternaria rosae TaxID=1187941 RepID=UPI001E8CD636|nr:uncharacterized protein BKA58DRAFT_210337 [Alternaria rosae]KAH6866719.1 hypothetical protein BKA58DRAFT_210337 [Alternaria rosae]